jgi:hypothetical protein
MAETLTCVQSESLNLKPGFDIHQCISFLVGIAGLALLCMHACTGNAKITKY